MFFVIDHFTLRLLENNKHRIDDSALMRFVYVARRPERENK